MKIHIMTDLEGCAGVVNARDYVYRDSKYYEHACELATLEVSAAVEGAFEAGAAEVLVMDGHGEGAIKRHLLHPRAKLLTGRPYPAAFAFGMDGSFTAGMIVGQHAMANTDGGHLCHTMSFGVDEYVLNDMRIGEIGLWMLVAGYFGVPVVMLSGDQAACDEATALVANIEVAAVKSGFKRGPATGLTRDENRVFNSTAVHLHPDEARDLIRRHAYRAVKRIPEFVPFHLDPPYTLTIAVRPETGRKKGKKSAVVSKDLLDLLSGRGRKIRVPSPKRKSAAEKIVKKTKKKPIGKIPKEAVKKVVKKAAKKTRKKPARKTVKRAGKKRSR